MQLPLIVIDKELYIENNLEKDVYISTLERKMNLNTATNHSIFLLYTVSLLTRSCMFVKIQSKNPFALDDLNFVLEQEEIQMLINHSHEQWWLNCDTKVARNAVA